ncbi:hypothetical protein JOD55_001682 [Arcanobacterium pluranimalium]|nr:hypothetical protein [Arcanobacterium pluranimalium]
MNQNTDVSCISSFTQSLLILHAIITKLLTCLYAFLTNQSFSRELLGDFDEFSRKIHRIGTKVTKIE